MARYGPSPSRTSARKKFNQSSERCGADCLGFSKDVLSRGPRSHRWHGPGYGRRASGDAGVSLAKTVHGEDRFQRRI